MRAKLSAITHETPMPTGAVKTYKDILLISAADVMAGKHISDNGSENIMRVFSGGVANSTTVNNGRMYVSDGGAANHTVVNGYRQLRNDEDHVQAGYLFVYTGGVASDSIVYHYGRLYAEGGLLSNAAATGHDAYIRLASGGSAVDAVVKDGAEMDVSSGGAAISASVSNDGQLYTCDGGRVESATAVDWGVIYVFAGGSADTISVDTCGKLHVACGGTATQVRENGGCVEIVDGANVSFVKNAISDMVISSGVMTVHSGTVANATTIEAGELAVYQGGIVRSAMIENGYANFY